MTKTMTEAEGIAAINEAERRQRIRDTDTHAPFILPEGLKQITPEELQLIALFRRNDERGQKLVFKIVTLHAIEFPKGA